MIQAKTSELEALLQTNHRYGGAFFSKQEIELFLAYYELVLKWNARLHLTTLIDPAAFFHRHILESDFAASYILPTVRYVWDLGSGLGVPGIPISVLRPDLNVNLVEAKSSKKIFLEEVIASLQLTNVTAIGLRIESLSDLPEESCLIARAVEQMESLTPKIIAIGANCQQIIFLGSNDLGKAIKASMSAEKQMKEVFIPGKGYGSLINLISST